MSALAQELIGVLDALIAVLGSERDRHWREWMQRSQTLLKEHRVSAGAQLLLQAYGGIGSFNELILGRNYADGQLIWRRNCAEVNQQFDMLRNKAWELAQQIVKIDASS